MRVDFIGGASDYSAIGGRGAHDGNSLSAIAHRLIARHAHDPVSYSINFLLPDALAVRSSES